MIDLFEDLFEEPTKTELQKKKTKKPKEATDLEKIIKHLDQCYYDNEPCIHPITREEVSDNEYDKLKSILFDIYPTSLLFTKPHAAQSDSSVPKVEHNPPMTSISKANGTLDEKKAILKRWSDNIQKELGKRYSFPIETWAVYSVKLDGIAVGLYYEDGKLIKAGLRPDDGIHGEDVTENVQYVEGISQNLSIPITCSIRGELICRKSIFEKKKEKLLEETGKEYKNPRNYTGGSIRQFKNPETTKNRGLSFIGYSIENIENPSYTTETERSLFAKNKLGIPFIDIRKFNFEDFEKIEKRHRELDYLVDGLVISVDNLDDSEQLGRHGNSPTGNPISKIAWKFADETATIIVKNITWQTGRTGRIIPVLEFDGVELEGTTVTKCTAHNLGLVLKEQIGTGSKIEIVKSGKIIPKISKVIEPKGDISYPSECPSCQKTTKKKKGMGKDMYELICENPNCPSQIVGKLSHYLSIFGSKGLAEATIEKLVESQLVLSFADFYRLTINDLSEIGITERQGLRILASIHMISDADKIKDNNILKSKLSEAQKNKKKVQLGQLIAALGIPGSSKGTGRALGNHFGSFDKIRKASENDFKNVDDIGDITAKSLFEFFSNNQKLIDDLLNYVEIEIIKAGSLSGRTFCFTGGFPNGKRYWQNSVEKLGAKVASSVSKKTTDVVIGSDPGIKAKKAKDLNINTMDVYQLQELIYKTA